MKRVNVKEIKRQGETSFRGLTDVHDKGQDEVWEF